MKLLDVVTAPWAILPEKLIEIQSIYSTHLRGEKIDLAGVEARIGKPLKSEHQSYQVVDGVAVLPVEGVLAKRMNLMSSISGGDSTELIGRDLKAAAADPAVTGIVLAMDSPGGSVDGTQALAKLVAEAASKKPVCTWIDGTCASAAYWIGAAAGPGNILISADTSVVGSIGVVATHVDVSKREEAMGLKITEIVAGQYKRINSQYGPLSESGRAAMQSQVDAIYSVFVGDVAEARGVSEEQVISDMADGRLFIGQAAVKAGLVDGVATLDQAIARVQEQARARAGVASAHSLKKGMTMELSKETIAAEHPEIAEAFRAEGALAERERIQAVEAQMLPGHKALIDQLKADGKTTGPEAAAQVLAAERNKLAQAGADLAADAPKPVPFAASPAPAPVLSDRDQLAAKARQYQADHPGTDFLTAINAVAPR